MHQVLDLEEHSFIAILMALKRPIANSSKIFSKFQRNYSKIQKQVLAIVFSVKKFFQYFFDKKFILVLPQAFTCHLWQKEVFRYGGEPFGLLSFKPI